MPSWLRAAVRRAVEGRRQRRRNRAGRHRRHDHGRRCTRPSPTCSQQAFFEDTGSDESLATERDTTQDYVDYFSAALRALRADGQAGHVKASGAPDDAVAAKADAIKVATELHTFASFGGPGQTTAYADELAARGVLCVGDCVIAEPQSFLDRHAPVRVADHGVAGTGERTLGRVRRQAARHRQGRVRRRRACGRSGACFGVVHYDDDAGTFAKSVQALRSARSRTYGVKPATTVPYSLDIATCAAGRAHDRRQAEERRRHQRDPRRRPRVPHVPDPGGDRAGLVPRVGRARLRVHRHRGVRSPVRPAAVGARVRRVVAARRAPPTTSTSWATSSPGRPGTPRGQDVPGARAGPAPVLHRRAPRRRRSSPPRRSRPGSTASRRLRRRRRRASTCPGGSTASGRASTSPGATTPP